MRESLGDRSRTTSDPGPFAASGTPSTDVCKEEFSFAAALRGRSTSVSSGETSTPRHNSPPTLENPLIRSGCNNEWRRRGDREGALWQGGSATRASADTPTTLHERALRTLSSGGEVLWRSGAPCGRSSAPHGLLVRSSPIRPLRGTRAVFVRDTNGLDALQCFAPPPLLAPIGMDRPWARCCFGIGMATSSTPLSKLAWMLSGSAPSGSAITRWKAP